MTTQEKREPAVDHTEERSRPTADTAVELADQLEGEKLSPWTPALFRLYLVLAAAYLCGCLVRT